MWLDGEIVAFFAIVLVCGCSLIHCEKGSHLIVCTSIITFQSEIKGENEHFSIVERKIVFEEVISRTHSCPLLGYTVEC